MKYYLLNPTFVEAPIEINNKEAVFDIERKLEEEKIEVGGSILIRVDKMFYKLILKEKNDGEFTNDEFNLMKRAAKHVIQLCKEDSETLYIIEGIQLFQWFNRDQFKSKPLIIKGTSMLTSSIRGNKRDFTENGKLNKVGMIKTLPQRLKWESEDEKSLNQFKKEMKK